VTNNEIYLAVIAAATLIMAIVQIGVIVVVVMLAKRVNAAVERIEGAAAPIAARLDEVATEALSSMAAARSQMDRLESMTVDVVNRVDQTVQRVQSYVLTPARQGMALMAGARAALQVFRRQPFFR